MVPEELDETITDLIRTNSIPPDFKGDFEETSRKWKGHGFMSERHEETDV